MWGSMEKYGVYLKIHRYIIIVNPFYTNIKNNEWTTFFVSCFIIIYFYLACSFFHLLFLTVQFEQQTDGKSGTQNNSEK